ncbi:unnamed protein product [Adineta steineri]|uniref:Uncharacterized protein n=1 Tax=Adineta steineri TaxID=433720 RepID=A0A813QSR6_9BILA|nr:unnamed protein product [Adineta steineri]CAF3793324.1 unnamed protein product [Adineta steineri]
MKTIFYQIRVLSNNSELLTQPDDYLADLMSKISGLYIILNKSCNIFSYNDIIIDHINDYERSSEVKRFLIIGGGSAGLFMTIRLIERKIVYNRAAVRGLLQMEKYFFRFIGQTVSFLAYMIIETSLIECMLRMIASKEDQDGFNWFSSECEENEFWVERCLLTNIAAKKDYGPKLT